MFDQYRYIEYTMVPKIGDLYRSNDNYICQVAGVWHLWSRDDEKYYSTVVMLVGYPTASNFNISVINSGFTKIEF